MAPRMRCLFWKNGLLVLLGLVMSTSTSVAARIVSGPMLAWQEHREVLIWLETEGETEAALLVTPHAEKGMAAITITRRVTPARTIVNPMGSNIHHFVVDGLSMGQSFRYEIELDGRLIERPEGVGPYLFRTKDQWEHRRPPPDIHFLTGSCAYFNDEPTDRPGSPYGQDQAIFEAMADTGAQFMVWLGDNMYLRESDWTSRSGIFYRWRYDRANPALQRLLRTMHHYGTWDDHDFGPNDAGRSYELKDITYEAWKAYFPTIAAGEHDNRGIYTRFKQGDAEFFILDGRYHRDCAELAPELHPGKSILGERQLRWFLDALSTSAKDRTVNFRFVVVGSQFLNPFAVFENFAQYPHDRQRILDFIEQRRIPGVIFLTGDRHFGELSRLELSNGQSVIDFTSSPLTAGSNRRPVTEGDRWAEANNPIRVPGTLFTEQHFGSVRITGLRNDRVVRFSHHGLDGSEVWSREVRASELRPR